jgi:hypothetical protein
MVHPPIRSRATIPLCDASNVPAIRVAKTDYPGCGSAPDCVEPEIDVLFAWKLREIKGVKPLFLHGLDWKELLQEIQPDEEISHLRLHTHRGRPLASDSMMSKLEKKLGRRLRPLPVGRPKQKRKVKSQP